MARVGFWVTVSRAADLVGIGVVVVGAVGGGLLLGFFVGSVPGWLFAIATAAGLLLLWRSWPPWRRRAPETDPASIGLEITTAYLSQIDDVLGEAISLLTNPSTLAEKGDRIAKLRDLVFTAIVQGVHSQPGEKVRCVYLEPYTHEEDVQLAPKFHQGHSTRVEALRLKADRGSVAGIAFREGRAVYVEDGTSDKRLQATPGGRTIGSLLCVPVRYASAQTTPEGVLSVSSTRSRAFSAYDREFISVCASLFALIQHLARLADAPSQA